MFCKSIKSLLWTVIIVVGFVEAYNNDRPCAAKKRPHRSVVCVCNATYCDTITREIPKPGRYMAYTSSESGLRFKKTTSLIDVYRIVSDCSVTIELEPNIRYQTIHGFGGAVTDSAGLVWDSIKDDTLKQYLIDSYFSEKGLEYNMIRTHIGGCDFSTRRYSLNDYPVDDKSLSNFSLSYEDYNYKLPMIKEAMKAAKVPVFLIGSVWSPPVWMKTQKSFTSGYLKDDYYQPFAEYLRKFVEEYKKNGVQTWALTTTNEPQNCVLDVVKLNCLGWTPEGMASWIVDNLVPTIKNYDRAIKIIGVDDQRNTLTYWFTEVVKNRPEVATAIDGVALHFYNDDVVPPTLVTDTLEDYPHLFVISTEASIVSELVFSTKPVDLGAWIRAEKYAHSIFQDLNYNYTGWIDWNLNLNTKGGPCWTKQYIDAAIIVDSAKGVFYKQPTFYILGHFAKFVPRGSIRIKTTEKNNCLSSVKHVAFLTPYGTIVVVLLNEEPKERVIRLKFDDSQVKVFMEPKSIVTVEFENGVEDDSCDCD